MFAFSQNSFLTIFSLLKILWIAENFSLKFAAIRKPIEKRFENFQKDRFLMAVSKQTQVDLLNSKALKLSHDSILIASLKTAVGNKRCTLALLRQKISPAKSIIISFYYLQISYAKTMNRRKRKSLDLEIWESIPRTQNQFGEWFWPQINETLSSKLRIIYLVERSNEWISRVFPGPFDTHRTNP